MQKRDLLNRTKQTRDMLRMDNLHLRQRGGLVVHTALLRDFEEQKDEVGSVECVHVCVLMSSLL